MALQVQWDRRPDRRHSDRQPIMALASLTSNGAAAKAGAPPLSPVRAMPAVGARVCPVS